MLTWWQAKKRGEAEWLVAARLVSAELEQLLIGLRAILRDREVQATLGASFFRTSAWEEHQATIARRLPNDPDDPKTDELWLGLSRVYANVHLLGDAARQLHATEKIAEENISWLRGEFENAARAYEALTGLPPDVQLPALRETGARTGARPPDPA